MFPGFTCLNLAAAQNSQRKRREIGFVLKALLLRFGSDPLSPDSDWQAVTHHLYSLPFASSVRYCTRFHLKWNVLGAKQSLSGGVFASALNSLSYAIVHK